MNKKPLQINHTGKGWVDLKLWYSSLTVNELKAMKEQIEEIIEGMENERKREV